MSQSCVLFTCISAGRTPAEDLHIKHHLGSHHHFSLFFPPPLFCPFRFVLEIIPHYIKRKVLLLSTCPLINLSHSGGAAGVRARHRFLKALMLQLMHAQVAGALDLKHDHAHAVAGALGIVWARTFCA